MHNTTSETAQGISSFTGESNYFTLILHRCKNDDQLCPGNISKNIVNVNVKLAHCVCSHASEQDQIESTSCASHSSGDDTYSSHKKMFAHLSFALKSMNVTVTDNKMSKHVTFILKERAHTHYSSKSCLREM